jgi:hypothetical protein
MVDYKPTRYYALTIVFTGGGSVNGPYRPDVSPEEQRRLIDETVREIYSVPVYSLSYIHTIGAAISVNDVGAVYFDVI